MKPKIILCSPNHHLPPDTKPDVISVYFCCMEKKSCTLEIRVFYWFGIRMFCLLWYWQRFATTKLLFLYEIKGQCNSHRNLFQGSDPIFVYWQISLPRFTKFNRVINFFVDVDVAKHDYCCIVIIVIVIIILIIIIIWKLYLQMRTKNISLSVKEWTWTCAPIWI